MTGLGPRLRLGQPPSRGREGYRVHGGNRGAQGRDHWDKMGMRKPLEAVRSKAGEAMVLENNYFIEEILPNAILRKLSDADRRRHAPLCEARRMLTVFPAPIDGDPTRCACESN